MDESKPPRHPSVQQVLQFFAFAHLPSTPGNDYCNGQIAVIQSAQDYACMVDCLHIEDVAALLAEKGLDKRPPGK